MRISDPVRGQGGQAGCSPARERSGQDRAAASQTREVAAESWRRLRHPRRVLGAEAEPAAAIVTGGPLALRADSGWLGTTGPRARGPEASAAGWPVEATSLVDRLLVGRAGDGRPEVRIDVGAGPLGGASIRLVSGPHGLEALFVVPSVQARDAVRARLLDLARALRARGVEVARCELAEARRSRRGPGEAGPGEAGPGEAGPGEAGP